MRRGLLLLVCAGLFGVLSGCHSSQKSDCGCGAAPAGGGTLAPTPLGSTAAPIGSFSSGAGSTVAPPLGR